MNIYAGRYEPSTVFATEIYTTLPLLCRGMSPSVDALRNEIRVSVGRYERQASTAFTKEALAAICDSVHYEVDADPLPPKPQMRAGILWKIGELDDDDPERADRPLRKAELEAVAEALRSE